MNHKRYFPVYIVLLLVASVIISQLPIVLNIWHFSFDDGTYSHAYLIPFISGYLYWVLYQNNELILRNNIAPSIILLVFITAFLLVIFTIAQFPLGYRIFIILFYAALFSLLFKSTIRTLFPAFFLFFLIPIWGILISPLQRLSTFAVTSIMEISNIPTFVEGNIIHIPNGIFEIAGGCSGLRYLIVSLAISSLFIFLHVKQTKNAITFLVLATIGALATNWIRITALILIGHYTDMKSDLMADHNMFGWYLYIPYMFALFLLGQKFFVTPTTKAQPVKYEEHKPAYLNLLVSVVALLATSAIFLNNTILNKELHSPKECQQIEVNLPEPNIFAQHQRCVLLSGTSTKYLYIFSGAELGQTVDYYLNDFQPLKYNVERNYQENNWQVLVVSNNISRYMIKYQFISNNISTNNLNTLKKFKLKNALLGIRSTELYWIVTKV